MNVFSQFRVVDIIGNVYKCFCDSLPFVAVVKFACIMHEKGYKSIFATGSSRHRKYVSFGFLLPGNMLHESRDNVVARPYC